MYEIVISFSEVLEESINLLKYVGVKRAEKANDYYRHAPCGADTDFLRSLLSYAVAEVSMSLRPFSKGYEIRTDNITFRLSAPKGTSDDFVARELTSALRRMCVKRTVKRWLGITGITKFDSDSSNGSCDYEAVIRLLSSSGRGPLRPRPLHPL